MIRCISSVYRSKCIILLSRRGIATSASSHALDTIRGNVTTGFTDAERAAVAPHIDALSELPLVKDMEDNAAFVREGFHWPAGKRRLIQAPSTLAYGALAGTNDLPILPLVYRWTPGNTPNHLNTHIHSASFEGASKPLLTGIRVPGVSMVQYLGPGLGFNGAGCNPPVHTGVPAALLDDVTARVSLSNTPDKPAFTANFKLEYLQPISTDTFVVLDAWITKIEGRKTFVASYLADAQSKTLLVRAQSLFVCAA
ncbi:hypothetical protein H4S02_001730 [Coemansia sp. RSA 2611]|nr:hypothetical protein H4S01_003522 [Coemansia sp. RSA 2610]KAJ2390671.1 hypothetical protein H4S02_001730 [Coemansia sp. RSA 2611]